MQSSMEELFKGQEPLQESEIEAYCRIVNQMAETGLDSEESSVMISDFGFTEERFLYVSTKVEAFLLADVDSEDVDFADYELPTEEEKALIAKHKEALQEASNKLVEAEEKAEQARVENFKKQSLITEDEIKTYCGEVKSIAAIYLSGELLDESLSALKMDADRFLYIDAKIQSFAAIEEDLVSADDLEPYSLPTKEEQALMLLHKESILDATDILAEELALSESVEDESPALNS